jgi:hypothetical protein
MSGSMSLPPYLLINGFLEPRVPPEERTTDVTRPRRKWVGGMKEECWSTVKLYHFTEEGFIRGL